MRFACGPANIPTPVFQDGYVYSSNARRFGGGLVQLHASGEGVTAEEVYFERDVPNTLGGQVLLAGYLYGTNPKGPACAEFVTGKIKWQSPGVGPGAVTYADGNLYLHGENGDVALVEATPEAYREKGRFTPAGQPKRVRAKEMAWAYPVVVKPRTGSGSRDVSVVRSAENLARMDASADFLVQEYLPGEEYSVDVLADAHGRVVAAVPRCRERVDSGVSVAGRTLHDEELERMGAAVVEATGLTYISNVQFRRDAAGRPALLEVNPRVPGALPLTMASGVDMPRLAMDSLRGRPLPNRATFHEMAMVRFLEERFIELGEVKEVAA